MVSIGVEPFDTSKIITMILKNHFFNSKNWENFIFFNSEFIKTFKEIFFFSNEWR